MGNSRRYVLDDEDLRKVPDRSNGKAKSTNRFVLDDDDLQEVKKKDGGTDYSPTPLKFDSASASVGAAIGESPRDFLLADIETGEISSQLTKLPGRYIPNLAMPFEQQQEVKNTIKKDVFRSPASLTSYTKNRITHLQDKVDKLESQKLTFVAVDAGGNRQIVDEKAHNSITSEQNKTREYIKKLKGNVSDLLGPLLASQEDLSDPEAVNRIGKKYLKGIQDTQIEDDEEVLKKIESGTVKKKQTDLDRTSQHINYRINQAGSQAINKYYNEASKQAYQKAEAKLDRLNELLSTVTTPQKEIEINELIRDKEVKDFLDTQRSAIQFADKAKNAIDQFPQVKRRELRKQLNDAYFTIAQTKEKANLATGNTGMNLLNWIFGDVAGEKDIPALAKATGLTEDEVRDIVNSKIQGWFGSAEKSGVRIPGMFMGVAQATDKTLAQVVMGARRFFDTEDVETKNRILSDKLTDYNIRAQKAKLFDDAGKLNFNPYSVFNTMGEGIGQTAIYAAPSLATGGFATGLTASNAIGKLMSVATTTSVGFAGSYEDAYKEAARYTDDEDVRRAYAFKVGMANGLSESILEPATIARKIGFGKISKEGFEDFAKVAKDKGKGAAIAAGFKEVGKVIGVEDFEELAALVGETRAKKTELGIETSLGDFVNDAIETLVTTTITTLPLGVGAGLNIGRDDSSIRKESLFEAGNEADIYKEKLEDLFERGEFTQTQYNQKVAVVNKMQSIVASVNKATKNNGKPLSYSEKVNLAAQQFRIAHNEVIKEDALDAQQSTISADTSEARAIQKAILEPAEIDDELLADRQRVVEDLDKLDLSKHGMMGVSMQGKGEELLRFVQEQATGLTNLREQDPNEKANNAPAYQQAVDFVGPDLTYAAVSVLTEEEKKFIQKKWKEQGIEVPTALQEIFTPTEKVAEPTIVEQVAEQVAEPKIRTPKEVKQIINEPLTLENGKYKEVAVTDVVTGKPLAGSLSDKPITANAAKKIMVKRHQSLDKLLRCLS